MCKTLHWFLGLGPVISALQIPLVYYYQNGNIIAVISCEMTGGAGRSTRNGVKGSNLPQGKRAPPIAPDASVSGCFHRLEIRFYMSSLKKEHQPSLSL